MVESRRCLYSLYSLYTERPFGGPFARYLCAHVVDRAHRRAVYATHSRSIQHNTHIALRRCVAATERRIHESRLAANGRRHQSNTPSSKSLAAQRSRAFFSRVPPSLTVDFETCEYPHARTSIHPHPPTRKIEHTHKLNYYFFMTEEVQCRNSSSAIHSKSNSVQSLSATSHTISQRSSTAHLHGNNGLHRLHDNLQSER